MDTKITEYIEKEVEKKINQLLEEVDVSNKIETKKQLPNYTIEELYKGTIDSIINIINELTDLFSNRNYLSKQTFNEKLFNIFLNENRKIYLGIILIFISFILYFIDNVDV